ncbi:nucleotide exchange factor GrpE [Symmachiella dynata]|uniref:nucleotide exchange factor GrpE n=1 Tax=Symmachiella dynata TaxID=2527995 RepID=UPI0030EB8126
MADETPNENPDNTAAEAAASDDQEPTLEEQLAAAIAERDTNLDRWRRAEAECENVRKRMRRELEEARKYESLGLSRDILPALDNLRRAIEAAGQTHNLDQLIEGVELVAKQFQDALNKHQVIAIDAVNKPFNSEQHEAMQQLPSADHPPMTVIQELEQGYTLHDRLVRPSKVIVSKAVE